MCSAMRLAMRCGRIEGLAYALTALHSPAAATALRAAAALNVQLDRADKAAATRRLLAACFGPSAAMCPAPASVPTPSGTALTRLNLTRAA
jgi:hypothetical protein